MTIYARLKDGVVVELLHTDHDILGKFSPALVWVDCSAFPDIAEGWLQSDENFVSPAAAATAPDT